MQPLMLADSHITDCSRSVYAQSKLSIDNIKSVYLRNSRTQWYLLLKEIKGYFFVLSIRTRYKIDHE